jgi:hypothetical protein
MVTVRRNADPSLVSAGLLVALGSAGAHARKRRVRGRRVRGGIDAIVGPLSDVRAGGSIPDAHGVGIDRGGGALIWQDDAEPRSAGRERPPAARLDWSSTPHKR